MSRVFAAAAETTWLMTTPALESLMAIVNREPDLEALATRLGRPLDNTRTVEIREGVAVVPIMGPIVRYANIFTAISGGTSTEVLALDIQRALDDPAVTAIVLEIDSPGGAATGINELGEMIFNARGDKPIVAYVGGQASSAAYWIASAADEVIVDRTAQLGSIGVIATVAVQDADPADAKRGVRRYEIISQVSPSKRSDPGTEGGRTELQALVDDLAAVFVSAVARNRGVTEDTVANDFGRGGVLVGDRAVAAGMADRLGSLESTIAELADSRGNMQRGFRMARTTAQNPIALDAGLYRIDAEGNATPVTIDAAFLATSSTHQQLVAEAVAAAITEKTPAIQSEAVAGERKRLTEISALAEPGFEDLVQAGIAAGDSPEKVALAMQQKRVTQGTTLAGQRGDASPQIPGAATVGAPAAGSQPGRWDQAVAAVSGKLGLVRK